MNIINRKKTNGRTLSETQKAMRNYLKIYNQKKAFEIADRLKILRQIMKGAVNETLMQTDLIMNCRLKYTITIENMCDALRTGRRAYIKQLRTLTENME